MTYAFLLMSNFLKTYLIFFWFYGTLCADIHGQGGINSWRLLDGKDYVDIPFEYKQNFIILDVVLQNLLPLKFILDTGAENTILLKRNIANVLNIPFYKRIELRGSDLSLIMAAYVSNSAALQVANTKTIRHNILIMEEDHLLLEEFIGTRVDGILGADFFNGLIVHINFRKKVLRLTHPRSLDKINLKKHTTHPLFLHNFKPYLPCEVRISDTTDIVVNLLIDTGASLTCLLHNDSDSLIGLPETYVKGQLGTGLGGGLEGYSGRIRSLQLGRHEGIRFDNIVASFQAIDSTVMAKNDIIRHGILGMHIWERFDFILDFHHKNLYLKPSKKYNKPFEYDKSGLTLFAYGKNLNNYIIRDVLAGSPGEEIGLMVGDEILKIGIWPAKWVSLGYINQKLSGKAGKKIKLKIKRGNKKLKKTLILRDII